MTTTGLNKRKPQQARSADTKARILDAALKVFAEQGFDAANVRDIADLAGATHPMITYHFGSKDELWRAAVEAMFERIEQDVVRPVAGIENDPVLRFKLRTVLYVRYCAAHPEHAQITISEAVRGGERLTWMVKTFVKRNHAVMIPEIKLMMQLGVIPKTSVVGMLYALAGMCQLPFVIAREADIAFETDISTAKAIKQHTDVVFQLLFREPYSDTLKINPEN